MITKGFLILLTLHGLTKAQEEDEIPRRTHYDTEAGNMPNDTDISVVVVADPMWVLAQQMDFATLEQTMTNSIQSAKSWYLEILNINFIKATDDQLANITTLVDLETTHALITLTSCKKTHEINQIIQTYNEIIQIAITDMMCNRLEENGVLIPMTKPGEGVKQLIQDFKFANTFPNWERYNVIIDESISSTTEHDLYQVLSDHYPRPTSLSMMRMNRRSNIKSMLGGLNLYQLGGKFLIIVRKGMVGDMVKAITDLRLLENMDNEFAFIITDTHSNDKDISPFFNYAKEGNNLAFIYNSSIKNPSSACPWGLSCIANEIGGALVGGFDGALIAELPLFAEYHIDEFDVLRPSIRERYNKVAREVKTWLENKGTCNKCTKWMMETVEGTSGGSFKRLDVGFWTPAGPYLKDTLFPHVSCGFRARTIDVASLEYPPWQTYIRNEEGEVIDYSGFIFEVLNQISYKLNFTYNVVEPPDGQWGINKNGQWNGMIKQVMDKEVMIAAAAFATTYDRMEVVNFTDAVDFHPYAFMYKKPKAMSKELLLINPFTPPVWIGVGIMTVIIGPIYYFVHRMSYYYTYTGERNEYGLFQMNRCILYCVGAILQQGGVAVLPTAESGKIFITAWWLFVITVVTYYSGMLTALILIPQIEPALNDFESMVIKQSKYEWGFLEGSDFEEHLKMSTEQLYKDIYDLAERHRPDDLLPDSLMYERIKNDDHVYIDWLSYLQQLGWQQYQKTRSCDFTYSKQNLFFEHVALAFPKDSPWISRFNKEIRLMLQSGLTIAWKQMYGPPKTECDLKYVKKLQMIDTVIVSDMQGSFYILFGGVVLSAFWLLGEWIHYNNNKNKGKTLSPSANWTP